MSTKKNIKDNETVSVVSKEEASNDNVQKKLVEMLTPFLIATKDFYLDQSNTLASNLVVKAESIITSIDKILESK